MATAKDISRDILRLGASAGQIIEAVAVPTALVDSGWNIITANARLLGVTGYKIEELWRRNVSAFCALTGPELERLLEDEGAGQGLMTELVAKGNERLAAVIHAAIVPDAGGQIVMTILTQPYESDTAFENERLISRVSRLEAFREGVLNIIYALDSRESELENARERLETAKAHLIQASKLNTIGELAAGLAHELSQPTAIIKGLTQSLLKGLKTETPEAEKGRLILEAASRMEQVIRHMSVFSRTGAREYSPCDLNNIVKDVLRLSSHALCLKSIDVELLLGVPPLVRGSATRLEQVLLNLIANAMDAMAQGGRLTISTSSVIDEKGRRRALVSVSDTGTGIPGDKMEHIFEPFYTTKEPGKGTGLGLSISRGIITEHGGYIRVESAPGRGTTFHITIPEDTGAKRPDP